MKRATRTASAPPVARQLPPGHYLLSEIGEVVATLRAKGVTVNGLTWDNRLTGTPTLWVDRRPTETRAG